MQAHKPQSKIKNLKKSKQLFKFTLWEHKLMEFIKKTIKHFERKLIIVGKAWVLGRLIIKTPKIITNPPVPANRTIID